MPPSVTRWTQGASVGKPRRSGRWRRMKAWRACGYAGAELGPGAGGKQPAGAGWRRPVRGGVPAPSSREASPPLRSRCGPSEAGTGHHGVYASRRRRARSPATPWRTHLAGVGAGAPTEPSCLPRASTARCASVVRSCAPGARPQREHRGLHSPRVRGTATPISRSDGSRCGGGDSGRPPGHALR